MNTRLSNNTGVHGIQIIERDGPAPPAPAVEQRLLAYYSFNGSANDDTNASLNDATLSGDASFGPGRFGQALTLDGTRDFATVPAPTADLRPTDQIAISVWVRNTDANAGEIVSLGDHYGLRMNNGNVQGVSHFFQDIRPDNADGWMGLATSTAVPTELVLNDGNWHHIVAQKTASQLEIYIDGVRAASAGATIPGIVPIDYFRLGQSVFIGAHGAGNTGFDFSGGIDELRIFRGTLSQENILSLYQNNVVPEPSSVALLVIGGVFACGFAVRRRRRRA
jgi:sialidase-1